MCLNIPFKQKTASCQSKLNAQLSLANIDIQHNISSHRHDKYLNGVLKLLDGRWPLEGGPCGSCPACWTEQLLVSSVTYSTPSFFLFFFFFFSSNLSKRLGIKLIFIDHRKRKQWLHETQHAKHSPESRIILRCILKTIPKTSKQCKQGKNGIHFGSTTQHTKVNNICS